MMIRSAGKSKVSPPPPEDVPLQYSRPNMQQVRDVLEAFELSPENQSRPLDVAVRPKYPRQELRVEVEPNEKHHVVEQKQHRATRRFVGALVSVVLTAASMHLLIINHVFEGELLSKQTTYLLSSIQQSFPMRRNCMARRTQTMPRLWSPWKGSFSPSTKPTKIVSPCLNRKHRISVSDSPSSLRLCRCFHKTLTLHSSTLPDFSHL